MNEPRLLTARCNHPEYARVPMYDHAAHPLMPSRPVGYQCMRCNEQVFTPAPPKNTTT